MNATPLVPSIPAHYTLAQLRQMKENATIKVLDARSRRNRKQEMTFQAAITALESRIDELEYAG